jgi:hypothetical protein
MTAVTLAACGGGGGGSINGSPPAPTTTLRIDAGNGEAATKVSYEAAVTSVGLGDVLSDSGLIAGGSANVSKAALGQASKLVEVTVQGVPIGPQTTPCLVNGSITVSGDLANPVTLTANDTLRVVADQCDDGLDQVIHGQLDFTVASFSGDILTGLYALQMAMTMTNFQVTVPTDSITSNGDARVTLDTLQTPQVSASVTGNSMTTDSNASSETLFNYGSAQTLDAGITPSPYTWSAYGTLDSTQLPGAVDYSTPLTFEGDDVDYPHTGELLVEGDNSSARLIAVDNVNVRIEYDYDGNGTVDETTEITWAELADQ